MTLKSIALGLHRVRVMREARAKLAIQPLCATLDAVRALQEPVPAREPGDPDWYPYPPDWHVHVIADRGPGHPYRWMVRGTNGNCEPGAFGRLFRWDVPSLSWRYDLSKARLVTVAEAEAYWPKEH